MGIIHNLFSIDSRTKIVKKRYRMDDIDVDFMIGKNHNGALLAITDRITLCTRLKKLEIRGSVIVNNPVNKRIKQMAY
jgi:IS30 family transposase